MTRSTTCLIALPLTALATTLAAVSSAGPAGAEVLDSGTFDAAFTETVDDFCDVDGLTVEIDTAVRGRFRLVARGPGSEPYFAQKLKVDERITNVATGEYVTSRDNVLNKDLRVERDGDLVTITVLATGNSTLYDSDGRAIARNPGQTRFEIVIDDNGTPTDPEDDVEVSFEIVKGSTGRSDDFCAAIVDAIG